MWTFLESWFFSDKRAWLSILSASLASVVLSNLKVIREIRRAVELGPRVRVRAIIVVGNDKANHGHHNGAKLNLRARSTMKRRGKTHTQTVSAPFHRYQAKFKDVQTKSKYFRGSHSVTADVVLKETLSFTNGGCGAQRDVVIHS